MCARHRNAAFALQPRRCTIQLRCPLCSLKAAFPVCCRFGSVIGTQRSRCSQGVAPSSCVAHSAAGRPRSWSAAASAPLSERSVHAAAKALHPSVALPTLQPEGRVPGGFFFQRLDPPRHVVGCDRSLELFIVCISFRLDFLSPVVLNLPVFAFSR